MKWTWTEREKTAESKKAVTRQDGKIAIEAKKWGFKYECILTGAYVILGSLASL